ncbi:DUF1679 domain-containing protein [Psychrobacillus glaciei]|uniref:DUF1679 domain-containing protein n=1 Tax=Psychrobacillus glaciei TaxID=2283160 RepID=A0A5J6SSQ8_9BACI|nr:phosphotransferase [Psychrobacillus glaciei]QFF99934.1 DUF1679 domain-containing protein [Psychrobacillus glaciei]
MSQIWSADKVVSEQGAAKIIERQFPQLKPVKAVVLGKGFDNLVFLVNNKFVFRFPRREFAAELIQTENKLLPVLSSLLPIPIPYPIYQGVLEGENPWTYGGYKSLPGETPKRLSEEQRMKSAIPLARFLRVLHNFPLNETKELQVPFDQIGRIDLNKRRPMFKKLLEEAFEKNLIQKDMYQLLQEFLTSVKSLSTDQRQTLVHGDLHIRNMLVDEEGKVSAVIDWGDTHIGHPAIDLSIVYSFLPPEGRKIFFDVYGDVQIEEKKAANFKAIYTTLLLLLYSNEQNDHTLKEDCLDSLHIALKEVSF